MSSLKPAPPAARLQMRVALLMLSVVMALSGYLDLLTRSKSVAAWLERKNEESCRQTRKYLQHRDFFQDPEEKWLYKEVPEGNFSKGGVYFLGPSSVLWSTKFWELPADLQAVIHNFGMRACNQQSELLLLRYLVERTGMLEAGGEKTLIVLGTSYHAEFYPDLAFTNVLERHGLFAFDPRQGIRPVHVNAISKSIDFEETRLEVCLVRFREVFLRQLARWRHHGTEPPRKQDPAQYADLLHREVGPDWRKKIDETIPLFRETVDYLQSRRVQVRVVFMPRGSWEDGLPYGPEYQRQITAVCAEKQIPVSDWSHLLSDEDFADSVHPNIFGTEKVQPAFLDFALPFLHSTHALPRTP